MTNQNLYPGQSCHPTVVDLVSSQEGMMVSWIFLSYHQSQQTVSLRQMKHFVQEILKMMTLILMISQGDLKT